MGSFDSVVNIKPRLGGRAVLRNLRHTNNWTPVILLTPVGQSGAHACWPWVKGPTTI